MQELWKPSQVCGVPLRHGIVENDPGHSDDSGILPVGAFWDNSPSQYNRDFQLCFWLVAVRTPKSTGGRKRGQIAVNRMISTPEVADTAQVPSEDPPACLSVACCGLCIQGEDISRGRKQR
jgi:hypothetical protein